MSWNNEPHVITQDWVSDNPQTYWHMSSPVAYAIERAAGGFTGQTRSPFMIPNSENIAGRADLNEGQEFEGQYNIDTIKVNDSLMYFRAVFASDARYTIVRPEYYKDIVSSNQD